MSELLKQTQAELQLWRDEAIEHGWLPKHSGSDLDLALAGDPAQLFAGVVQRPLVVAFFGGTGVGKSSLLNRLAGAEVARTGVVRPTSREVTVYAHESLSLAQLPAQIPADKVQMSSHSDASSSHVVWIDTPDVDSVATEHRDQVLAWLPYVDLVIYVVSPERYKDDAGWRMLRAAGDQHAWMFVLNQWDRGEPEQLTDFKRVLGEAGFSEPQVYCTICSDNTATDDFALLRGAVEKLGEKNNVHALVAQAEASQAERLRASTDACIDALGSSDLMPKLAANFEKTFAARSEQIIEDMSWQINATAMRFQSEQGGWRQLVSGKNVVPSLPEGGSGLVVWDARAGQQVRDALAELAVAAGQQQLPSLPLRTALLEVADDTEELLKQHQRDSLAEALARPGTRLHRWLFRLVAAVAAIAPIAALAWIAYRVVISFYGGNEEDGQYLGSDFAINSLLLLAVAWLLPALLREKTRPSLSAAVGRALKQGLGNGLAELTDKVMLCTQTFDNQRIALREEALSIVERLPALSSSQPAELSSLRPRSK